MLMETSARQFRSCRGVHVNSVLTSCPALQRWGEMNNGWSTDFAVNKLQNIEPINTKGARTYDSLGSTFARPEA